ncbi:MAG: beta-ketoacyl synthase N-terminal-like domain-containing protein [Nannocystales bacterium]
MSVLEFLASSARTPVGLTGGASVAAARAGISRLQEDPLLVDRMGKPVRGARDTLLDPGLRGPERLVALAREPLREILDTHQTFGLAPHVLLAVPESRPGFDQAAAATLLDGLRKMEELRERNGTVTLVERGHAGGLLAFSRARSMLGRDMPACIVGGVDSYFEPATLSWLSGSRQLAQSGQAGGFYPGEASAFMLVGGAGAMRQLRKTQCPRLVGLGSATEDRRIKTDLDCLGEGLGSAIREATKNCGPVDDVYCDVNGERYRSEEWGFAQRKSSPCRADAPTRRVEGA